MLVSNVAFIMVLLYWSQAVFLFVSCKNQEICSAPSASPVLLVPLQCFFYCSPSQPILSLQKHLFSLLFSPNLFLLKTCGPNFQFLFYYTSSSLTRFLSTSSTSFYSRPNRPENPVFFSFCFPSWALCGYASLLDQPKEFGFQVKWLPFCRRE